MYQPGFLITIDTEKDMCNHNGQWGNPGKLEFRNIVDGLPQTILPLFSEYNLRSTWLVSPEVMRSAESVALLASVRNAELGTHLHGEFVAPEHMYDKVPVVGGSVMQCMYPIDVEMEKLRNLTELFIATFKMNPVSFRAGRYAISKYTAKWLALLGYLIDSSVVPNTKHPYPPTHSGCVDFSGLPEIPYKVDPAGNIWKPGNSTFLEIPITAVAKTGEMESSMNPVWFRPGITSVENLKKIIDHVAEENSKGLMRPLVMMFHSMEIMPGFTPYVTTEQELSKYLDDIKEASEYAMEKGFIPRTMHEEYNVLIKDSEEVSPLPFSQETVSSVIDEFNAQHWFKYRYSIFGTKSDHNRYSLQWTLRNIPKDAHILSLGCGVVYNLLALAQNDYAHLYGLDIDAAAINVSRKLAAGSSQIHLDIDDCIAPSKFQTIAFDMIEAIGWVMLLEDFPYIEVFRRYNAMLQRGGFFIIDIIDAAYNYTSENTVHTADRKKPIEDQRSSEYKTRLSENDMHFLAKKSGFRIVRIQDLQIPSIPRKHYFMQKTAEL